MMAKIRIKDHDRRPELSLAVVGCAAVIIWLTMLLWTSQPTSMVVQRRLKQVQATYRCDGGHRFTDALDVKSKPCRQPGCDRRAWPLWSYQCSKDGRFMYQLRYTLDERGRPRIMAARPLNGTWQDVEDDITCPLCGRALAADLSLCFSPPRSLERSTSADAP